MYALFLFIEGKVEVIFKNMRHIHGREKRKIQGNRPSGPDTNEPKSAATTNMYPFLSWLAPYFTIRRRVRRRVRRG